MDILSNMDSSSPAPTPCLALPSSTSPRGNTQDLSSPPLDESKRHDTVLTTPERNIPFSHTSPPVPNQHASPHSLQEANAESLLDITERMEQEKALVPGNQEWAGDEEKLFRILFLREYNPLLPRQWSMDFRGIPIPALLFSDTDDFKPIIYSRAGNDFKGEV